MERGSQLESKRKITRRLSGASSVNRTSNSVDSFAEEESTDLIARVTRDALRTLDDTERKVIELYHFMGLSPSELARELGVGVKRAMSALRSAEIRMREQLRAFAQEKWNVGVADNSCAICAHPDCEKADVFIRDKKSSETWGEVITRLRDELGIVVRTPQALIGHRKYHMKSITSEDHSKY